MSTLAQWLQRATSALTATSPTPRLDAEVLARFVLKLSPTQLIARAPDTLDGTLDAERTAALDAALARRARGEPVAYIVGTREFWSLPLKVTTDVLIPRPETELLVELALQRIAPESDCVIADLGTGSGAIAIALAHERPRARVIATDISPAALALAQENARALNIANVEFRASDWCAAIPESCCLIVSNPPYIASADPHLGLGDVRFEPRQALTAGADGLDAIRAIAAQARTRLAPTGTLIVEHGFEQQGAVIEIMTAHGYGAVQGVHDLAGHPRAVIAQRA